ncbi:MAG: hypothetical protein HeimC2_15470 [Candidatus Heimdallarchaeota archaeon LC_2]|nr:MAG: hypothetical protein HeimC2_15470 [Candidatus Heimdallarchaeota archaeon LC_2]
MKSTFNYLNLYVLKKRKGDHPRGSQKKKTVRPMRVSAIADWVGWGDMIDCSINSRFSRGLSDHIFSWVRKGGYFS